MKPFRATKLAVSAVFALTVLSLVASTHASAHFFDDVKTSTANLLAIDVPSAGWILALIFSVVLIVIIVWAVGERAFIWAGGMSIAFGGLVGWLPVWFIVFIGLIIALLLIGPFRSTVTTAD